jgi:hypothetical protein
VTVGILYSFASFSFFRKQIIIQKSIGYEVGIIFALRLMWIGVNGQLIPNVDSDTGGFHKKGKNNAKECF